MEKLYRKDEAANWLGNMHSSTLDRHVRHGRIASLKIGKFVMFRESDLSRFLKTCERKAVKQQ